MSENDREDQITSMVPQLGTSPNMMAGNQWDMRILSYIVAPEKIPSSFKPVLYAATRRDVVIRKKRFWDSMLDNYLHLVISVDGRGRNDQIRAENALKGIPVQIHTPPEKPGILERLFDKDSVDRFERWKEKEELGVE